MAYWLVKSEPSAYSWEQLEKDGETCWSGVRNYAARVHLRNMHADDSTIGFQFNDNHLANDEI